MIDGKRKGSRGIVLTIDIVMALMLLLIVLATAYSAYGSPSRDGFDGQLMRAYLQDAATVMAKKGYFSAPLQSSNSSNTSGIREVLAATPSSVCMQVSGYGTVVGQGLEGYWKFDEDSGAVATDSSGNGRIGTIYNGGSLSEAGKSGHSLTTDGDNDYLDTGYDVDWNENAQVSISFWVKPDNMRLEKAGMLGKTNDRGWSFYQSNDDVVFTYMDSEGGASNGMDGSWGSGTLVEDQWTHLAYVWNGTESKFYANGTLASSAPSKNPALNMDLDDSMLIGGNITISHASYFPGSIDDVRVYSRALSESEIKLIYSNPSNIQYVVQKAECSFAGANPQSLTVPFVLNKDQDKDSYYYATLRAWPSGAKK
jgi:hypothetical protein